MNPFVRVLSSLVSSHRKTGAQRTPTRATHPKSKRRTTLTRSTRMVAAASAVLLPVAIGLPAVVAQAAVGPVGSGFTVTPSDLAFILKQIKIAEAHSASLTVANPCGTLVGGGVNQIPDPLTAYGLRTVDGSCNNLIPGREKFAAADVPFPRLTDPVFKPAEPITAALPVGAPGPTSYAQKKGNVVDSQPRVISNLVVDQTSTNPAAVAAAGFPVRTQGNPGKFPCTTDPKPDAVPPVDGIPANCVPTHDTLFIPNVTTDVGLSPPYNSLFTFFGQFFDHGVDQTVKSGGAVFVPLKADDPLIPGPDHIAGNADDLPVNQRFMVLTRAQNQPGPDGIIGDQSPQPGPSVTCTLTTAPNCDHSADDVQNANNTDTPWVDQSQTYTSHSSHQVFLREYVANAANHPVSTGKLLGGIVNDDALPCAATPCYNDGNATTGSISTWAATKKQAANLLGLKLVDRDVTNIPMIAADPYGQFIPGPARGLPQYVTETGMVEGNLATPVPVPANVIHFDTPFLTDIAHNADPSPDPQTGVAPVPDADSTASADFAAQPAGTYDDEMLNDHFTCGDGRCNENIALSSIHQVFHHEHDRLIDDIKNTLSTDTTASGADALSQWQLPTAQNPSGWNGERLFQAARYVNEMEYQHLVFEEFARKMQPAVRPFHVYSPDINPAIDAEFAHAVYRFGHSMLDDTVARTNTDAAGVKTDNSIPLLTAFLNPPEYFNGHAAGTLSPEAAAGSVVMGSSDQVGNELDEFVTETLRNNLLGLPLDLPVLNLTRAREAGVPSLNEVRRQIFASTNDGQLTPYTSWSDYGQHLKHPESLVNLVAAYGKHPSITSATTLVAKRDAARAIVDPRAAAPAVPATATTPAIPAVIADVPPADAADFMFSTGAYASSATGVTVTGLDDVDLWVGGLAEVTNLGGGLLGSTFNYVFQTQLEKLQDGDRLYYLNRTPGMNLRSQLEGNSFSELIMRNTDNTNSLKADAFATADCKFQLGNLTSPATVSTVVRPAGYPAQILGAGSVNDDATTTDCDENLLLLKQPNGTIQYRAINSVDPSGINGQSVYNGTAGVDKVNGGNDNDTFWGGLGNDVIEGNGGDDIALGGGGNDIITDLSGADILKGGPGNDAIDAGLGDDISMGGDGQDFINGGANDNETFAGPGNDFIIAGQGADAVLGDGGDDWIQGGSGQDLLQGDHAAPFFDDPAQVAPGNDIFIGQVGENDYDAEGGDDIMAQNPAIDRNAGAAGFDWAIHQYDTVPANDDMEINNNLLGVPIQVVVNRDRWQEVEANSGSALNDVIRGTSRAPATVGGAGFAGCDALDPAGVARISGLNALVTSFPSPLAPIVANAAANACPLKGDPAGNVWGEGDILLGGLGSDTLEGRGADDIIDGDRSLEVHITVRTNPADPASEIGRTDLMEHAATSGNFGAGTAGMTLQAAVFAGLVDPGNLVAVREIVSPATALAADCAATAPVNCDKAVFSGPAANYTVTTVAGVTTVTDNVGTDGTDTLRNIEVLQFADTATPGAPTAVTATGGAGQATVSWVAPLVNRVPQVVTSYSVEVSLNGTVVPAAGALRPVGNVLTTDVTGLAAGSYTFRVLASNAAATPVNGPLSLPSGAVTVTAGATPGAPTSVIASAGNASATVTWTPPAVAGGSPITGYTIDVFRAGVLQPPLVPLAPAGTTRVVTGLTNGTAYSFVVHAVNTAGAGPGSVASNTVTPALPTTAPGSPTVGTATAGNASATVNWTAPANNGGSAITGFSVRVVTAAAPTTQVGLLRPAVAGQTSLNVTGLTNGTAYRFQVAATNAIGPGAFSGLSTAVTPSAPVTAPDAPVIGTATAGNTSAVVNWTAPANNGSAITGSSVRVVTAAAPTVQVGALRPLTGTGTSLTVTGLTNGTAYRFQVQSTNGIGPGAFSGLSAAVTPATAPAAPAIGTSTPFNLSALARWTAPANGGSAITSYTVRAVNNGGTQIGALRTAAASATSLTVTGLTTGVAYRFQVRATNAAGTSAFSAFSVAVIPLAVPNAPVIAPANPGAIGGAITATANWTPPPAGGPAVTGYVVTALQGTVVRQTSGVLAATARSLSMALPAGNYTFVVQARNALGLGAPSAASQAVTAR
jgi:Ca2+-binding RTX toxin-like protein